MFENYEVNGLFDEVFAAREPLAITTSPSSTDSETSVRRRLKNAAG